MQPLISFFFWNHFRKNVGKSWAAHLLSASQINEEGFFRHDAVRLIQDPNLLNNGSVKERVSARSLVWSRTSACHADDPGSNLGARTTYHEQKSSENL